MRSEEGRKLAGKRRSKKGKTGGREDKKRAIGEDGRRRRRRRKQKGWSGFTGRAVGKEYRKEG